MKELKKFKITMLLTIAIATILSLKPLSVSAHSPESESEKQYVMIDAKTGEETVIELPDDKSNNENFFSESFFGGNMENLYDNTKFDTYSITKAVKYRTNFTQNKFLSARRKIEL